MKHAKNRMSQPQTRATEAPQTSAPALAEPRKPPCPYCGKRKSRVQSTQGSHRYRRCEGCGRNFTTVEVAKRE